MKNLLRAAVVCLSLSLLGGCANQTDKNAPVAMNVACVLTGDAVEASSPTVDYMGGKLAFCCDKCVSKWNTMDDAAKKTAFDARKK